MVIKDKDYYNYAIFQPLMSAGNSSASGLSGGGGAGGQFSESPKEKTPYLDPSVQKQLGTGAVNTGVAILSVPDPLPFVDEIGAIILIGVGFALIWTAD